LWHLHLADHAGRWRSSASVFLVPLGILYRRRRKAKANHKGHKGRRRAIARNAKIPKKSKVKNRKIFETQRNRGNRGKEKLTSESRNKGRRSFIRPSFIRLF